MPTKRNGYSSVSSLFEINWLILLHQNNANDKSRYLNKANLRDLIAATGLVILPKMDLNRRYFGPCNLEIWRMT